MTPMMPNSWAQMIQNQQQPVMPQLPQNSGGPPAMMPNSFMDMLRMRQPGFMPQGGNGGGPMPSPPMGGMQPAPWQPQRPVMPPFGTSQPQPMEQPQMPMPANSFLRRPLGLQF